MVHEKILVIQAYNLFWFPVKDIKITDNFYKILNFLITSWASILEFCYLSFEAMFSKFNLKKRIQETRNLSTYANSITNAMKIKENLMGGFLFVIFLAIKRNWKRFFYIFFFILV